MSMNYSSQIFLSPSFPPCHFLCQMDPVQKAVINHTFGVPLIKTKRPVISCNVCQIRFNSEVLEEKPTANAHTIFHPLFSHVALNMLYFAVHTPSSLFFLCVGGAFYPVFFPRSGYWHGRCGTFVWAVFWQLWPRWNLICLGYSVELVEAIITTAKSQELSGRQIERNSILYQYFFRFVLAHYSWQSLIKLLNMLIPHFTSHKGRISFQLTAESHFFMHLHYSINYF